MAVAHEQNLFHQRKAGEAKTCRMDFSSIQLNDQLRAGGQVKSTIDGVAIGDKLVCSLRPTWTWNF